MIDLSKRISNVLVSFDEVIKDPNLIILDVIRKRYQKDFAEFIDIPRILNLSNEALQKELVIRGTKNIFEWLKIKDFDYSKNYDMFYDSFKDLYVNAPNMAMVTALKSFIKEDFIKTIYVWSNKYDRRKMLELEMVLNSNKIEYVTGNYLDVFGAIEDLNIIIDNDAERVAPLINKDNKGKLFMIGRYGYNYTVDPENGLVLKNNIDYNAHKCLVDLIIFHPIFFTQAHFMKG